MLYNQGIVMWCNQGIVMLHNQVIVMLHNQGIVMTLNKTFFWTQYAPFLRFVRMTRIYALTERTCRASTYTVRLNLDWNDFSKVLEGWTDHRHTLLYHYTVCICPKCLAYIRAYTCVFKVCVYMRVWVFPYAAKEGILGFFLLMLQRTHTKMSTQKPIKNQNQKRKSVFKMEVMLFF